MTPINPAEGLDDTEIALAEYGITRVPVDRFDVGGFTYSRLADAIAEAKRRRTAGTP